MREALILLAGISASLAVIVWTIHRMMTFPQEACGVGVERFECECSDCMEPGLRGPFYPGEQ